VRILITNDDGISNPGLSCLERVAGQFGNTVVVAPDRDRSGVGQAISLTRPLRVSKQAGPTERYSVEGGTPTDCVYLGLHHVLAGKLPDLVLSGINPGPNLGWDVLYSGTAAGAREGVLQEVPAVAFSLVPGGKGYPFDQIEEHVAAVIQAVLDNPAPALTFYNVNIPNPLVGPIHGMRATRLGHRYYSKEVVSRTDPRGGEYLWIGGKDVYMPDIPGSDCNAIRDGYVSITPLACDSTDTNALRGLPEWTD
jgi:5'-nucleotidase